MAVPKGGMPEDRIQEEVATSRRTPRRVRLAVAATLLLCLVVSGCARAPSTVQPDGPKAGWANMAWWILCGVASFVCIVVIALAVGAAVFRRHATKVDTEGGQRQVLVFGLIIPAVILAGTFALSINGILVDAKPPSPARVSVHVIGHQWWWGVSYPKAGVRTANEIHVPVGEPVHLLLTSADVIHSFWVPQITPKMDMIPGRPNATWFTVDKPGIYRGECAEFCGLQHAHMDFQVIAQSPSAYQRWLRNAQRTPTPTTAEQRKGLSVFMSHSCASCHTIKGTPAHARIGPDLTHVGSRNRLAAGVIPNNFGNMSGWIANSQTIKPGNRMPPEPMSPDALRAVVTYLESLK